MLGHESVCGLLIDNEANVDASMRGTGWTALMHAAHNGYLSVVQVLVKSKLCSPNKTNCLDMTALDVAMAAKHFEIEAFLNNKTDTMRSTTLRQSLENLDILEATKRGNYDRVKVLLAADPTTGNTTNSDGATCLMFAAMRGQLAIAELLVDHGVRLNDQDKIAGWTALMQAIYYGHVSVMRLLLGAGADVGVQDFDGYTAFEHASLIGDTDAVRLLASMGLHKQTASARIPRKASRSSSGGGARPRTLTDKDFLGKTFESLMASQSRMFSEHSSDGSATDSGLDAQRTRARRRRSQKRRRRQASSAASDTPATTGTLGSRVSWLSGLLGRVHRVLFRKSGGPPISQGQTGGPAAPSHNRRTSKKPRFSSNKIAPMPVQLQTVDSDSNDDSDDGVHQKGLRTKREEMQRAGQRQRTAPPQQTTSRHQQQQPWHRRQGGPMAGQPWGRNRGAEPNPNSTGTSNTGNHGNAPSPLRHSSGGSTLGSTVRGVRGAGLVGMNFVGAPVSKFPTDLLAPIKPPFMPPPAFELTHIERPKFERPVHRAPSDFGEGGGGAGGGGATALKGHALSRMRASFLRPQNERTVLGALPSKPVPRVPSNSGVGVATKAHSPGSMRKDGGGAGQRGKKTGYVCVTDKHTLVVCGNSLVFVSGGALRERESKRSCDCGYGAWPIEYVRHCALWVTLILVTCASLRRPRVTFQLGPSRAESATPNLVSSFSLSAKDSPIAVRKTSTSLDSDSGPAIQLQNVLREHGLLHIYSVLAQEEIDIDVRVYVWVNGSVAGWIRG